VRYALVKQANYEDLYWCPPASCQPEVPLTSLFRTGPAALFTDHNTDFYIVNDTSEYDDLLNVRKDPDIIKTNQTYSVNSEDVDWSVYDCVICVNIAVKPTVVEKYPDVLWAYYLSDPKRMPRNIDMTKPLANYDLYLNLRSARHPQPTSNWEINFPYCLQYFGCFEKIDIPITRSKVFKFYHMNIHDRQYLTDLGIREDLKGYVNHIGEGEITDFLSGLSRCKYSIKFSPREIWGNSIIEAIACGCLVFSQLEGNGEYKLVGDSKGMCVTNCFASSYEELIFKIKWFDQNETTYLEQLQQQRDNLTKYCYELPMKSLNDKINEKRSNL
jgi:hypothetical protein